MRASHWVGLLLLAACGTPASESPSDALPFYDSPEFTPRWLKPAEVPEDFHHVPPFSLTDQHGATITEKHLDGNIAVVDFFFTSCPGICPMLTKNMALVDASLPDDAPVVFLSHSVTPTDDTVEVLQQFAEAKGVTSARWHLLTGDRDVIYHLGRSVYYAEEDLGVSKSPDDFLHTENMLLLDRKRRLRGIYNGLNKTSIRQLIGDAKLLMNER